MRRGAVCSLIDTKKAVSRRPSCTTHVHTTRKRTLAGPFPISCREELASRPSSQLSSIALLVIVAEWLPRIPAVLVTLVVIAIIVVAIVIVIVVLPIAVAAILVAVRLVE